MPAFGVFHSGPYSVRIPKNTDHNNSEYGHFLRSGHQENLNWSQQNLDLSSGKSQLFVIKCRPAIMKINLNLVRNVIPYWRSAELAGEKDNFLQNNLKKVLMRFNYSKEI